MKMKEIILAEVKWVHMGTAGFICETTGKEYTLTLPMGRDVTKGRTVRLVVIQSMGLAVKLA
jgi:hypothetical protein